jgi:hypothetical protein
MSALSLCADRLLNFRGEATGIDDGKFTVMFS